MERHVPTIISTRIHVLDPCQRKALCLHSMFHLLRRLPLYDLNTSPSSTQVVSLRDLY
ncbi:hypothetical protein GW17_00040957 [Ensete ventricosum]|nr:hypothetical protein GW17_00040957 [Ensete ventricosum]